ncbi:TPA: hypothetical protein ACGJRV_000613 [Pseudomonas aeruginosa]|uniref:hypothetical protein n=1 Tax=Pseudomonas aeruginosa TaxID=287 RepID=UPI0005B3EC89|nr:hypothetical protein [Pseudomonas aeruginosa]
MTTKVRAQERIKRIADAKSERDADHFESEAMGYLAALLDEGAPGRPRSYDERASHPAPGLAKVGLSQRKTTMADQTEYEPFAGIIRKALAARGAVKGGLA